MLTQSVHIALFPISIRNKSFTLTVNPICTLILSVIACLNCCTLLRKWQTDEIYVDLVRCYSWGVATVNYVQVAVWKFSRSKCVQRFRCSWDASQLLLLHNCTFYVCISGVSIGNQRGHDPRFFCWTSGSRFSYAKFRRPADV